jgi:hypothetical protein
MTQFAAGMIAAPIDSWPLAVWRKGRRRGERLRGFLKSTPTSVLKVGAWALIASARYRPRFYPGQLTLFTPVDREPGVPSLQAIWRTHAGTLSITTVQKVGCPLLNSALIRLGAKFSCRGTTPTAATVRLKLGMPASACSGI